MTSSDELGLLLDDVLHVQAMRGLDDPNGLWRQGRGNLRTVGLTLEANLNTPRWVADQRLDALMIHRPWGLPEQLPGDPTIFAYHLAFDERLTMGFNPMLAAALGMTGIEVIGQKAGRPLGMIGDMAPDDLATLVARIEGCFGPVNAHPGGKRRIHRLAVVGAMWPELIREAVARGAEVYVTGDQRARALAAVAESGIAIVNVGHAAAESWGLGIAAEVIRERFPDLKIVLADSAL